MKKPELTYPELLLDQIHISQPSLYPKHWVSWEVPGVSLTPRKSVSTCHLCGHDFHLLQPSSSTLLHGSCAGPAH